MKASTWKFATNATCTQQPPVNLVNWYKNSNTQNKIRFNACHRNANNYHDSATERTNGNEKTVSFAKRTRLTVLRDSSALNITFKPMIKQSTYIDDDAIMRSVNVLSCTCRTIVFSACTLHIEIEAQRVSAPYVRHTGENKHHTSYYESNVTALKSATPKITHTIYAMQQEALKSRQWWQWQRPTTVSVCFSFLFLSLVALFCLWFFHYEICVAYILVHDMCDFDQFPFQMSWTFCSFP